MSVSDHCRDEVSGIELEDLSGDMRFFAEAAGMDAVVVLLKCFSGGTVYVPRIKSLTREKRDRAILKLFNGVNHRELATNFGLSIRQVRNIVQTTSQGRKA